MARPHPRFNHVAMSVPAELLDERGRKEILELYARVFGWTEMPTLTVDRERLVLRAWSHEQFVFLHAHEAPMRCPAEDHLGLSVAGPAEFEALLVRAREAAARDPRVQLDGPHLEDYGFLKLHGFYLRFLLPLRLEVQCFEWAEGVDPGREPPPGPTGSRTDPGGAA